ncbi:oxidoreductase [Streptomyces acidiscabies]|uniref:Oxidoreductase n=1 Tax=Streptomyces acidiscabies TaxID=42234 RepID=A0AAP6BES3_9ACTN|nr:oxidoreductase [Streptomyces acidiscabies]MBP5942077.1 oxidoreductase [Streptomyces sp. LBUM 1476]MBZ3913568.1 oxidoreductase [Streptomyces acidiscabies]MDX2963406.1 oxidoreductase [Streptomyces acidiscabies]MDX3023140.1 oxidoreductase [Streptomyces acidiscabies]MDX3792716.1 oxidoreductase [Streptomyces acidiscabies]
MSSTTKVALVTGASSGIGADTALRLREAGYTVYGAARRVERMTALRDAGVHVLSLDVTDEDSLRKAIDQIISTSGRIDVLVNNAGYGSYGSVEDVPLSEARAQIEVNVFGLARLTQLVLPHMRAQRSGTIVNVSSMGGKLVTPLGGWYHASKYAVEALSDALRMETKQFGIDVVVVEPGSIRTEWGAIAAETLKETSGKGAYSGLAEGVSKTLAASSQPDARMTSAPSVIGKTIVKIANARRPRTRYRVGFGAAPTMFLRWLLPDRAFDFVVRSAFGV